MRQDMTETTNSDSPRAARMVTEAELADRLNVSVRTLQRYRAAGCGPQFARVGDGRGVIRYAERDIATWLQRQKRR